MAGKAGEAGYMGAARTRFEQWRNSRSRKSPIPDELWTLAINAARQHGVNRTAQQLRLNAGKLKRILLAAAPRRSKRDAQARDAGMTAEERLRFHQQHSKPILEALHGWLEAQFAERKVEPNSSLGKAITYLLRHWKALTLFLRRPEPLWRIIFAKEP